MVAYVIDARMEEEQRANVRERLSIRIRRLHLEPELAVRHAVATRRGLATLRRFVAVDVRVVDGALSVIWMPVLSWTSTSSVCLQRVLMAVACFSGPLARRRGWGRSGDLTLADEHATSHSQYFTVYEVLAPTFCLITTQSLSPCP